MLGAMLCCSGNMRHVVWQCYACKEGGAFDKQERRNQTNFIFPSHLLCISEEQQIIQQG